MESTQTKQLVDRLLAEPEKALPYLSLVYVDDTKLTIKRKQRQKDFEYYFNDRLVSDAQHLERIKKLSIPPAWQQVRITHLDNGHLQAVGRDSRKRKQYRYHKLWKKARNQSKFYRLASFGSKLPRIRKQVEKGLQARDWSQNKIVSLVIKLMDETHLRVGNDLYAQKNGTYGLTTLRKKHVVHDGDKLRFEFKGKRGKDYKVTIRNKRLVKLIRQCEEIPGWELFQFYDGQNNKRGIHSGMVNDFLFKATGAHFTAKDFRTWSATVIFYETMRSAQKEKKKITDKDFLIAFDKAAKALGNSRNICRKYYVHPYVVDFFEKSGKTSSDSQRADVTKKEYMSAAENAVLDLIKEYKPKLTS